ncbi:hypothetical protein V2J09_006352 [Rumex salicifolius]
MLVFGLILQIVIGFSLRVIVAVLFLQQFTLESPPPLDCGWRWLAKADTLTFPAISFRLRSIALRIRLSVPLSPQLDSMFIPSSICFLLSRQVESSIVVLRSLLNPIVMIRTLRFVKECNWQVVNVITLANYFHVFEALAETINVKLKLILRTALSLHITILPNFTISRNNFLKSELNDTREHKRRLSSRHSQRLRLIINTLLNDLPFPIQTLNKVNQIHCPLPISLLLDQPSPTRQLKNNNSIAEHVGLVPGWRCSGARYPMVPAVRVETGFLSSSMSLASPKSPSLALKSASSITLLALLSLWTTYCSHS